MGDDIHGKHDHEHKHDHGHGHHDHDCDCHDHDHGHHDHDCDCHDHDHHGHGHHHHHHDGEPTKTHRSPLVGLSHEERRDAINAAIDADLFGDHDTLVGLLAERCDDCAPLNSLPELLMLDGENALRDYAFAYGIDDADTMDAEELADTFSELLTGTAAELTRLLTPMAPRRLALIRKLIEDGGWREVPEAEVGKLGQYPTPVIPFVYSFHHDGVFTFVVPDEVMDRASELDWSAIESKSRALDEAGRFIDIATSMRGITSVSSLRDEWELTRPGLLDDEDFAHVLFRLDSYGEQMHPVVGIDDEDFALHAFVAVDLEELEEQVGEDGDPVLPEYFRLIQEAHRQTEPRPVPVEALADDYYLDWLEQQPGVAELVAFLDEHVPEGENDYDFSTSAIDHLFECLTIADGDVHEMVHVMEHLGLVLEGEEHEALVKALRGAFNAVPSWINNGWSPSEMSERMRA